MGSCGSRITGAQRIVAFADVHGAYDELLSILHETAVVDDGLHWKGGSTHLVSTGDLLDRGPDSRKVLDLLMRLESEAAGSGWRSARRARQSRGHEHRRRPALRHRGIHGICRQRRTTRYASRSGARAGQEPGCRARGLRCPNFPRGYFAHRQAFSPAGQYGAWLLSRAFPPGRQRHRLRARRPVTAGGGAGPRGHEPAHACRSRGVSADVGEPRERTADRAAYPLQRSPRRRGRQGAEPQSQALLEMQAKGVFASDTPIWFRGQALCYPLTEADNLEAALAALGVARVVEGHTPSRKRQGAQPPRRPGDPARHRDAEIRLRRQAGGAGVRRGPVERCLFRPARPANATRGPAARRRTATRQPRRRRPRALAHRGRDREHGGHRHRRHRAAQGHVAQGWPRAAGGVQGALDRGIRRLRSLSGRQCLGSLRVRGGGLPARSDAGTRHGAGHREAHRQESPRHPAVLGRQFDQRAPHARAEEAARRLVRLRAAIQPHERF